MSNGKDITFVDFQNIRNYFLITFLVVLNTKLKTNKSHLKMEIIPYVQQNTVDRLTLHISLKI